MSQGRRSKRHTQKPREYGMGKCPVCGGIITSAMETCHRVVDGVPQRVHRACQP